MVLAAFIVFAAPLLLVPPAWAQSLMDLRGGARAAALGQATTALAGDLGGHMNPAAVATHPDRGVTFYARQDFGLAELRLGSAFLVEPTRLGHLAAGASTFGFEDYREVHLTAGYARGIALGTSRRLHVGAFARYVRTQLGGSYGQAGALGLSLGGLVQVLPALSFGAHATNVNAPRLAGRDELPQTLAAGLAYDATDRFRVVADVFKDIDFPLSARAGVEVAPVEALAVRAGVTTEPTRFSAGAGVRVGHLAADVAAEQHLDLGWSPSVALSVWW
jgi:hypothetical protein